MLTKDYTLNIYVGDYIGIEDLKHKEVKDKNNKMSIRSSQSYFRLVNLKSYYRDKPYYIKPNTFLLMSIIDPKITLKGKGYITLKPEISELGWGITNLEYIIDFSKITLKIKNHTNYHVLPLWHKMLFADLHLHIDENEDKLATYSKSDMYSMYMYNRYNMPNRIGDKTIEGEGNV